MLHLRNKIIVKTGIGIFTLALFICMPLRADAAAVTVSFGDGFPFAGENMAPGQVKNGEFTVMNNTNDAKNLMIKFDDKTALGDIFDSNIAEMILVRLQKPDGSFVVMPESSGGVEKTLASLYSLNQAFIFDNLSGPSGNSQKYKLQFTFDTNAGNDYQNKRTVFDALVGIDAVTAVESSAGNSNDDNDEEDENEGDGADSGLITGLVNRIFSQSGQVSETDGEESDLEQSLVKGEETDNGAIFGEQAQEKSSFEKFWYYYLAGVFVILLLLKLGHNILKKFQT